MSYPDEYADAFRVPNDWAIPPLDLYSYDDQQSLFTPVDFDIPAVKLHELYVPPRVVEHGFCIPELEPLQEQPLEDLGLLGDRIPRLVTESEEASSDEEDNAWRFTEALDFKYLSVKLLNWDSFLPPTRKDQPCSPIVSELGSLASDVESRESINSLDDEVLADPLPKSLELLAVGYDSASFLWNEQTRTFVEPNGNGRQYASDHAADELALEERKQCGEHSRHLREFVEATYQSSHSFPALVALASAIDVVLSALLAQTSERSSRTQDMSQKQARRGRLRVLLATLRALVDSARFTTSNEGLASVAFEALHNSEREGAWLRDTLLEIRKRVSRPWLETVERWIGLESKQADNFDGFGALPSFVLVNQECAVIIERNPVNPIDYNLDITRMPSFIEAEEALEIFETGRNIDRIRASEAIHPLVSPSTRPGFIPRLEIDLMNEDIDRVFEEAKAYERSLRAAVIRYRDDAASNQPLKDADSKSRAPCPVRTISSDRVNDETQAPSMGNAEVFGCSEEDVLQAFGASMTKMKELPSGLEPPDNLHNKVLRAMKAPNMPESGLTVSSPPLRSASVPSIPLIHVQSRFANLATLRLLFIGHNLRHNLQVNRAYYLFGSGTFTSRLSDTIFPSDTSIADSHEDVSQPGLERGRLCNTVTEWLPLGNSERQLELVGILADAYQTDFPTCRRYESSEIHNALLPGRMSFATREPSPTEHNVTLNSNSLQAFDFLRLKCTPPPPLDATITESSLQKYDEIFKQLLRVLRMLSVSCELFRSSMLRSRRSGFESWSDVAQIFRIEAHHFVSSIASYFNDLGVNAVWSEFEEHLDAMEEWLQRDDCWEQDTSTHFNIRALSVHHEAVLDEIMFRLFLREGQNEIGKALEQVFISILEFSRILKEAPGQSPGRGVLLNGGETIENMYSSFKKHVRNLISGLEGVREHQSAADQEEGEGLFDHLLLTLATGFRGPTC